jgi:hypothetical protein
MVRKKLTRIATASSFGFLTASAMITGCGDHKAMEPKASLKITNGQTTAEDLFPAVVLLILDKPSGQEICTGTFVNDYQVITAAHCVADLDLNTSPVYYASYTNEAGEPVYSIEAQAREVNIHPLYEARRNADQRHDGIQPHDLAVLNFPISTAPATALLGTASPSIDELVTIVGFGDMTRSMTSDGNQSGEGAGVKRHGTNTIQGIKDDMLVFTGVSQKDEYLGIGQWVATGAGDSGGPLFHKGRLAGVTSGGRLERTTQDSWRAVSHYVDLSLPTNQDFIRSVIR